LGRGGVEGSVVDDVDVVEEVGGSVVDNLGEDAVVTRSVVNLFKRLSKTSSPSVSVAVVRRFQKPAICCGLLYFVYG
tara:strand:+ start:227 stop:457 length:231 start_codon:yes stop_codon:yes gene_type:complete